MYSFLEEGQNYKILNMIHQNGLEKKKYNGLINIMEPADPTVRFQMFERTNKANKATEYSEALGNIWEDNLTSQLFFSRENIQIIQNGLKQGVYEMSKGQFIIPNQNIDTLKIIMRSIFLQYVKYSSENITAEIKRLNTLVLNYCVPNVNSEADAYRKYLKHASTLPVPMEKPLQNDRDWKQLELHYGIP